eukprot:10841552-Lingulodinium_polyedra.AAC.1
MPTSRPRWGFQVASSSTSTRTSEAMALAATAKSMTRPAPCVMVDSTCPAWTATPPMRVSQPVAASCSGVQFQSPTST